jgi:hypothetical protein
LAERRRPEQAAPPPDAAAGDPRRSTEAMRSRYLGAALIGLAILAYWGVRLLLAG